MKGKIYFTTDREIEVLGEWSKFFGYFPTKEDAARKAIEFMKEGKCTSAMILECVSVLEIEVKVIA